YEVTLYAISKGEKESEPITVKVSPLTPPLLEAYNSLTFNETFGGATLEFSNSGGASLSVKILTLENGVMKEIETYYTKSTEARHSVRGFAAEPRLFAAVIRDRWGNLSDTISTELTPVFEEQIPKDRFVELHLPTDTWQAHNSGQDMNQIWDGRIAPSGGIPLFQTKPGSGMPQWFTFDMGRVALLSRYKFWHRGGIGGDIWAYTAAAPKRWEIY